MSGWFSALTNPASLAWIMGGIAALTGSVLLLVRSQRYGTARSAIAMALALTACWAFVGASFGTDSIYASYAESWRDLAWLLAIYRLFGIDGRASLIQPIKPVVIALAFVEVMQTLASAMLVAYAGEKLAATIGFHTVTMMHLVVVIGGLVLLHNLFGGATSQARQVLRWPALGVTLLWLLDLNYYAIAYLAESYPSLLAALRGALAVPVAAIIAFGPMGADVGLRLRPSRTVTFQSISLMLIGGYLAAMVAIAQWLAFAGNDFASLLQGAFVAIASLVALVVLPSERLRKGVRVLAVKHLFQHRYDYRSEWLRFSRTIGQGGAGQSSFEERVIRALADIVDSPAGLLLTKADSGELELASRWQWPTAQVPARALDGDAIASLEQASYIADLDAIRSGKRDKRCQFAAPEWLLAEPRAWALVPLLHYERLVGLVVLARPAHARLLDWEDFDLLRVAGQQLATYLSEHAGQAALAEASRFDDFNRRIAFVMHDIKNLASQMGLLARNAESHADNPAFRADMLVTLRNSADKLNALLARLSRYGSGGAEAAEPVRADLVAKAVADQSANRAQISLVIEEEVELSANRAALEQVLAHLVQNALDASPNGTPVFVRVAREGIHGVLEVLDSGIGMSPEFVRSRLFKPFDSTKPGGFGIGAYEARELVRAMNGRLEVESREGLGTRFVVRLPLSQTAVVIEAIAQTGEDQPKVA